MSFHKIVVLMAVGAALHLVPARAATRTGKVVDAAGQPVEGARVVASTASFWSEDSEDNEAAALARTDAAGAFTLQVPDARIPEPAGLPASQAKEDAPAVTFAVIYAPGFALKQERLGAGDNLIRLEAGRSATGRVVDENGQPVAGAVVRLLRVEGRGDAKGGGYFRIAPPAPLQPFFSTTTDASGQWTLQGLPFIGRAVLELDDARFVRVWSVATLGQPRDPDNYAAPDLPLAAGKAASPTEATPFTARPGATLEGRVLREGKPAAGVRVFASPSSGDSWFNKKSWALGSTGANGAYLLTGLAPGNYNILFSDPKLETVAPAIEGVTARAARQIAVPDAVLTPGGFVEGTVLDASTGQPIPKANLSAYGPQLPLANRYGVGGISLPDGSLSSTPGPPSGGQADERGYFKLRLAPGENFVQAEGPGDDYLRPGGSEKVIVAEGQSATLNLRLKKGATLSGVIVDETGKPLPDAKITIGERAGSGSYAQPDAQGKWSLKGLKPGTIYFSAAYGSEWEVIKPAAVTVPSNEPVTVTMRRTPQFDLAGRVTTPDGAPVAGAAVSIRIMNVDGRPNSWSNVRRTTDEAGRFSLKNRQPGEEFSIQVEKPGFKQIGGGQVEKKEGAPSISDAILQPLSARLTGRVVDAGGQPVAGALVAAPNADPDALAVTDAKGEFSLPALPATPTEVLAARETTFGRARGQAGQPLPIALQPVAPNTEDAARLLAATLEASRANAKNLDARFMTYNSDLLSALATLDPDRAFELAKTSNGTVPGAVLQKMISALATVAPGRAYEWSVPRVNAQEEPLQRAVLRAALGSKLASSNPAAARKLLREAAQEIGPADVSFEAGGARFRVAALAAKLQEPDAEVFLQTAQAFLERTTEEQRAKDSLSLLFVRLAGSAGPDLIERVLSGLNPQQQGSALNFALGEVTPDDAGTAEWLWRRMERAQKESANAKRDTSLWQIERFAGRGALRAIRVIGPQNPARALQIARTVDNDEFKAIALALAASYTPGGDEPTFREAMAAADNARYGGAGTMARVASLAFGTDPKLGRELFAQAERKLRAEAQDQSNYGRLGSVAAFAFYESRLDPARARLRLESEWAQRKDAPVDALTRYDLPALPRAMGFIDAARGREMAAQLPPEVRDSALRLIARDALRSPEEIARLAFSGPDAYDESQF